MQGADVVKKKIIERKKNIPGPKKSSPKPVIEQLFWSPHTDFSLSVSITRPGQRAVIEKEE